VRPVVLSATDLRRSGEARPSRCRIRRYLSAAWRSPTQPEGRLIVFIDNPALASGPPEFELTAVARLWVRYEHGRVAGPTHPGVAMFKSGWQ
jgi:hypothetical protein